MKDNLGTLQIFPNLAIAASCSIAWLVIAILPTQAQSVPLKLSPAQVQQISRDLTPFNTRDFFRRGNEQLEREIQLLARGIPFSSDRLLQIQEQARLQDFTQGEDYREFFRQDPMDQLKP